ncbi:hypothetical protein D3C74_435850 [compost metagenome]
MPSRDTSNFSSSACLAISTALSSLMSSLVFTGAAEKPGALVAGTAGAALPSNSDC